MICITPCWESGPRNRVFFSRGEVPKTTTNNLRLNHNRHFYPSDSTIADPTMVPDSTFLDYITSEKVGIKCDRLKEPSELYAVFYTMCYPPSTKSYLINSRDEPMEFDYAPSNWGDISEGCRKRQVMLRTTALVRLGARRGNVDDMLELAIRYEYLNLSLSLTHR